MAYALSRYATIVDDRELEEEGPRLEARLTDELLTRSGGGSVKSARLNFGRSHVAYRTELTVSFDSWFWTGRTAADPDHAHWKVGPMEYERVGVCWLFRVGSIFIYGVGRRAVLQVRVPEEVK